MSYAALLDNHIFVLGFSCLPSLALNEKVWFCYWLKFFGQLWFKLVQFGLDLSLLCMVWFGWDSVSFVCLYLGRDIPKLKKE